eukprot:scpid40976/ scgid3084/ 
MTLRRWSLLSLCSLIVCIWSGQAAAVDLTDIVEPPECKSRGAAIEWTYRKDNHSACFASCATEPYVLLLDGGKCLCGRRGSAQSEHWITKDESIILLSVTAFAVIVTCVTLAVAIVQHRNRHERCNRCLRHFKSSVLENRRSQGDMPKPDPLAHLARNPMADEEPFVPLTLNNAQNYYDQTPEGPRNAAPTEPQVYPIAIFDSDRHGDSYYETMAAGSSTPYEGMSACSVNAERQVDLDSSSERSLAPSSSSSSNEDGSDDEQTFEDYCDMMPQVIMASDECDSSKDYQSFVVNSSLKTFMAQNAARTEEDPDYGMVCSPEIESVGNCLYMPLANPERITESVGPEATSCYQSLQAATIPHFHRKMVIKEHIRSRDRLPPPARTDYECIWGQASPPPNASIPLSSIREEADQAAPNTPYRTRYSLQERRTQRAAENEERSRRRTMPSSSFSYAPTSSIPSPKSLSPLAARTPVSPLADKEPTLKPDDAYELNSVDAINDYLCVAGEPAREPSDSRSSPNRGVCVTTARDEAMNLSLRALPELPSFSSKPPQSPAQRCSTATTTASSLPPLPKTPQKLQRSFSSLDAERKVSRKNFRASENEPSGLSKTRETYVRPDENRVADRPWKLQRSISAGDLTSRSPPPVQPNPPTSPRPGHRTASMSESDRKRKRAWQPLPRQETDPYVELSSEVRQPPVPSETSRPHASSRERLAMSTPDVSQLHRPPLPTPAAGAPKRHSAKHQDEVGKVRPMFYDDDVARGEQDTYLDLATTASEQHEKQLPATSTASAMRHLSSLPVIPAVCESRGPPTLPRPGATRPPASFSRTDASDSSKMQQRSGNPHRQQMLSLPVNRGPPKTGAKEYGQVRPMFTDDDGGADSPYMDLAGSQNSKPITARTYAAGRNPK